MPQHHQLCLHGFGLFSTNECMNQTMNAINSRRDMVKGSEIKTVNGTKFRIDYAVYKLGYNTKKKKLTLLKIICSEFREALSI